MELCLTDCSYIELLGNNCCGSLLWSWECGIDLMASDRVGKFGCRTLWRTSVGSVISCRRSYTASMSSNLQSPRQPASLMTLFRFFLLALDIWPWIVLRWYKNSIQWKSHSILFQQAWKFPKKDRFFIIKILFLVFSTTWLLWSLKFSLLSIILPKYLKLSTLSTHVSFKIK